METVMEINKKLKAAMENGLYISAKADGKRLGVKPKKGWTIVLDTCMAAVLRDGNSLGDFTIEYEDGTVEKKSFLNADILGYIRSK